MALWLAYKTFYSFGRCGLREEVCQFAFEATSILLRREHLQIVTDKINSFCCMRNI